ncbi:MAG: hypothetical protein ACK5B9_00440 [Flavobacteriia bacterium]|jgi:hypothetical protein
MNNISAEARSVRDATWKYTQDLIKDKDKNPEKLEESRLGLVYTIEKSKQKIAGMDAFKASTSYRDSVISFLNIYQKVVVEDYAKIKNYKEKSAENFEYKEKLILAREEANTKLTQASEMINEVEKKFCDENGIKVIKSTSKTSENLKKANAVYKYYNSVFLIFFQPYAPEAKFLDALDKGDITKMEEETAKLARISRESAAKLNLKSDMDGDKSLVSSCQNLLDFYQKEADNDFVKIIEFQKFKAEYQKTKTTLENKPKADRVKGEVAEFNKLVAEYNSRMEVYNDLIINLNAKREALIVSWNTAGEDFEKKHLNEKLK